MRAVGTLVLAALAVTSTACDPYVTHDDPNVYIKVEGQPDRPWAAAVARCLDSQRGWRIADANQKPGSATIAIPAESYDRQDALVTVRCLETVTGVSHAEVLAND